VDDEPEMLRLLNRSLQRLGYLVHTASSGREAIRLVEETVFDLIISDMAIEDISGIELLEHARSLYPHLPIIIITGVGTIESAVEAIKKGAFHYLTKPFQMQEMEILIQRALEYGNLHQELNKLRDSVANRFSGIIFGENKRMLDLVAKVAKVADSPSTILILGETGTGKELLAKMLHNLSSRKSNPFVTVDCGGLTETLLESELFGHIKGSFTNAYKTKRGLLEEAQGGTVFLDEIGDVPLLTQTKLLRCIQEREIKPVGSNQVISIDVRFISATNKDIKSEVEKGNFREDLYYRLAVIPLFLPPLRERKEDIPLLIKFFLERYCKTFKKEITHIHDHALSRLMNHYWKGNVRELANVIERAVLLSDTSTLDMSNISIDSQNIDVFENSTENILSLKQLLHNAEREAIIKVLQVTEGNRSKAAQLLGISRRAFYDKIAIHKIQL
jgi:DNA-binding NtrC family response regulator